MLSRPPPASTLLVAGGAGPETQAAGPAGVIDTYDAADRIYLLNTVEQDRVFDSNTALVCGWRPGDLW